MQFTGAQLTVSSSEEGTVMVLERRGDIVQLYPVNQLQRQEELIGRSKVVESSTLAGENCKP